MAEEAYFHTTIPEACGKCQKRPTRMTKETKYVATQTLDGLDAASNGRGQRAFRMRVRIRIIRFSITPPILCGPTNAGRAMPPPHADAFDNAFAEALADGVCVDRSVRRDLLST
jgi:hypothetical protein